MHCYKLNQWWKGSVNSQFEFYKVQSERLQIHLSHAINLVWFVMFLVDYAITHFPRFNHNRSNQVVLWSSFPKASLEAQ